MRTVKRVGSSLAQTLSVVFLLLATGCVSPQTLQPLAQQNRTNIANYGSNVEAMRIALRKEVALHAALQVHRARTIVASELVNIRKTILPSAPTDADLADLTKPWYTLLKQTVDQIAPKLKTASGSETDAVTNSLAREHPAAIDIALGTTGFTIPRVLRDSVMLDEVNKQILAEDNDAVKRALMGKREAILAPYHTVVLETKLVDAYLAALDEYLGIVKEQATIASTHADAILAFSEAKPAFSSLKETFQNEELRNDVLSLVEKRRGKEFANRLRERLAKFDEVLEILNGVGTR